MLVTAWVDFDGDHRSATRRPPFDLRAPIGEPSSPRRRAYPRSGSLRHTSGFIEMRPIKMCGHHSSPLTTPPTQVYGLADTVLRTRNLVPRNLSSEPASLSQPGRYSASSLDRPLSELEQLLYGLRIDSDHALPRLVLSDDLDVPAFDAGPEGRQAGAGRIPGATPCAGLGGTYPRTPLRSTAESEKIQRPISPPNTLRGIQFSNARGGIRTHDLQIRNLLPCPC